MSRQKLTAQPLTEETLLNPTYATLTGGVTGIEFQNSGREFLAFICGSTASTATINFGYEVDGQTITPKTPALPTSNTVPEFLGPFEPSLYTQPDGNVYIDLSAITGVTVALLQLPGVH